MANLNQSKSVVNVGIDVGKHYLDVYIHEKKIYFQEENTTKGIQSILKRLSYYQVERLVMEATATRRKPLVWQNNGNSNRRRYNNCCQMDLNRFFRK